MDELLLADDDMDERANAPVAHRKYDAALDRLFHGGHDARDFWCCSNNTHTEAVGLAFAGHDPVFVLGEVLGAVDFFKRREPVVGFLKELGRVCATLGHLDEWALSVPAEHGGRVRRRIRPQEVQQRRVERFLLSLADNE